MRVNVAHIHVESPLDTPLPTDPVPIEIVMLSVTGEPFAQTQLLLLAEQSGFFDLPASSIPGLDPGVREQIRVLVRPIPPVAGGPIPCVFPPSVEVFDDATGKTLSLLDHPLEIFRFDASPYTPPRFPAQLAFPAAGLTAAQTLRINVAHIHVESPQPSSPDESVFIQIDMLGLTGEPVNQKLLFFLLAAGQSGFLDLDGSDLGLGAFERAEIRVVVRPSRPATSEGGINPCYFPASVEVFDTATMQTTSLLDHPVAIF